MNSQEFSNLLRSVRACDSAREWAEGKDLATVWATCERGDWLLWLVGRMADNPGWATRKQVVLAACSCAETALKFVKPGEDRPRKAIEIARAWVNGQASIEDVRKASDAPAAYAYAAYASAYAADAAYNADDVADAANASASAAYAAAAYAPAARTLVLAECADIVRKEIPQPYTERP